MKLSIKAAITVMSGALLLAACAAEQPQPPRHAEPRSIQRNVNELRLNWRGGPGIRLQKAPGLAPASWQDLPGTLAADAYTESLSGDAGFYRLVR